LREAGHATRSCCHVDDLVVIVIVQAKQLIDVPQRDRTIAYLAKRARIGATRIRDSRSGRFRTPGGSGIDSSKRAKTGTTSAPTGNNG